MYVSLFCDVGYVRESERLALEQRNNLSNSILMEEDFLLILLHIMIKFSELSFLLIN